MQHFSLLLQSLFRYLLTKKFTRNIKYIFKIHVRVYKFTIEYLRFFHSMIPKRMIRIINYIKDLVKWINKGKYHWATFLVIILTIMYLLKLLTWYTSFIASIFTIIGIVIILAQQLREAKQFSYYHPNTIRNWIKSFPLLILSNSEKRKLNVESHISGSSSVSAQLSSKISDKAPIESKIHWAIEEINILIYKVEKLEKNFSISNQGLSNKIHKLSADFKNVSASVNSIIAGHTIGAYDLNLLGIMLTLCGTLIQIFCVT